MIRGIQLLTLNIFGGTSKQGSFPKKSLWERRVRVPNAQGSRCGVWIVNVRIFVQTVLFVSSRKAGLIAFMGTPFPLSK